MKKKVRWNDNHCEKFAWKMCILTIVMDYVTWLDCGWGWPVLTKVIGIYDDVGEDGDHYNLFVFLHTFPLLNHKSFLLLLSQHAIESSHLVLYNSHYLATNLMLPWVKCALVEMCVSPPGAQDTGCNYFRKPLFRYTGCHRWDAKVCCCSTTEDIVFSGTQFVQLDQKKTERLVFLFFPDILYG